MTVYEGAMMGLRDVKLVRVQNHLHIHTIYICPYYLLPQFHIILFRYPEIHIPLC